MVKRKNARKKYSRGWLIRKLRAWAETAPRVTMDRFCFDHQMSVRSIYYYFPGGWRELKQEAGLNPQPALRRRDISDEDIMEAYLQAAQLLHRHPTMMEIERLTGISVSTIAKRFGSITNLKAIWIHHQKTGEIDRNVQPPPIVPDLWNLPPIS
ncbi:homing endonuclease associated repeat-containing protein [Calycomorphotria hydatis]|uniref:Uncharacterized protein n=1 Tax=Calycomorphotria hydatis TaxID=2528027 RepID=A0A517T7L9_9PLAN|nr:hypothetical protein [Calycomorphotria hydatis]QDT64371.1 hypothetical protein V22_16050 [Calycomorphotria hydatis]